MSNEPITDEILSAIIDDEADEETIAAVNADPKARARLEQMRAAVSFVAIPVPDATPERRSASIGAALAAASPPSEVSSLAAARHVRETRSSRSSNAPRWLAVAAAATFLIIAIPLLVRFGGSDADETATTAAGDVASPSFGAADSAAENPAGEDDAADDTDSGADLGDSSADAMEDAGPPDMSAGDSLADEPNADPVEDAGAADGAVEDAATPTTAAPSETDASRPVVGNLDILQEFITLGTIAPNLTADQVIAEGVRAVCVEPLAVDDAATFDLVILDELGGAARLILVSFNADGSTSALDAEDCAQLG